MDNNGNRKRKLEVDTNSNKRESRSDQNENASMSTRSVNGEATDGFETTLLSDVSPIISQEECVLKSSKNATTKAVTLLAKVDTLERVEYVNIVPRSGDGTKLVTGLHRCIGRQGSNIGHNNVFVSVLVEGDEATKTVNMGDILGYAQTFGMLLTRSLKTSVSKVKLDADLYLFPDLTTVVEATVESLNLENEKNYPIRFKSTNKSLQIIGERYTVQKGNSAKVRIKNVSEQIVVIKNGDILGTAESLISKEFIEEIQLSNDESIEIIEETDPSMQLPLCIDYGYVFIEIETMKASNNDRKEITQIGSCTSLSKDQEKKFFKVVEPLELKHYLDNFTMAGDLLKFLHLQKNEIGQFEYRKQFEIVEEGVEIPKCITEKEALQALAEYLSSFSTNCVLVSIKKETIELVVERMEYYQMDLNFLKGFCDWDSILGKTLKKETVVGSVHEFDEWYSENVSDNVSSNVHAEKVASMLKEAVNHALKESVNHAFKMNSSNSSSASAILLQASSPIRTLHGNNIARNTGDSDSNTPPAFLELCNSLSPNMPTTITMQTLETIEIMSDEEDPLPQASLVPNDRGSISRHNPNDVNQTSSSVANSAAPPKSIQNVEPEGSNDESHLTTENADVEDTEFVQSHDDLAAPTAHQNEPTISLQNNPPLQSNIIQSSTASQIQSHCFVCARNFACLNDLKQHLLMSVTHKNKIKQHINNLRISPGGSEDEGVLWWDLQKLISILSSSLTQHQMNLGIEDMVMLALHFDKRGIEIVKYIQKRIFEPTAPDMAPVRLVHFLGLLCQKSIFFKDLIECRIIGSFVHAFRKTSDKFQLNKGLAQRIEWENAHAVEAKTLEELDSEMIRICPAWMSLLSTTSLKAKNGDRRIERDRDETEALVRDRDEMERDIAIDKIETGDMANAAPTDATDENAMAGVKDVPVDNATVKFQEQGGSGRQTLAEKLYVAANSKQSH